MPTNTGLQIQQLRLYSVYIIQPAIATKLYPNCFKGRNPYGTSLRSRWPPLLQGPQVGFTGGFIHKRPINSLDQSRLWNSNISIFNSQSMSNKAILPHSVILNNFL